MEKDIRKITKKTLEAINTGFYVHTNRNGFGSCLAVAEGATGFIYSDLALAAVGTVLLGSILADSLITGLEEQRKQENK